MKALPWTRNGLLVTLLLFAVTPAIAELTQADLQAIREIVKQEITASEARTDLKLEKINTKIAVIKTEITAINKRLDFMQTFIIAVIASVGITILLATSMTYLGSKLGNMIPRVDDVVQHVKEIQKGLENDLTKQKEIATQIEDLIADFRTLTADSVD